MSIADIRRRIEALASAITPPRELMLLARVELLTDDRRCEWQRHQAAIEYFHARARDAGLVDGRLYAAMLDPDSYWSTAYPALRRDVSAVLYGPATVITDDDTGEIAARKYYTHAGIGITQRRGRR